MVMCTAQTVSNTSTNKVVASIVLMNLLIMF
jgi:hypothetical protein